MNKIKIAFFDLDGTLLNSNKRISEENIKSLKELKKQGIIIVFSTGRWDSFIKDIDTYNLADYYITNQGASIYDVKNKSNIYEKSIAKELILEFSNYLNNHDIYFWLNSYFTIYKSNELDIINKPIYQFVVICKSKTEVNNIINKLNNHLYLDVTYVSVNYYNENIDNKYTLNIGLKENTKGNSINFLLKKLHIEYDNTICFGDTLCDQTMFDVCKYKIAMENAHEELKKQATFITLSNDNDGISYYINNFMK